MRPRMISSALALAVGCALGFAPSGPVRAATVQVPNWQLTCADGAAVDFHETLAKGPVLVAFWALWCKPCLKELPHLDRLARAHEGRLTVLAVNIDSQRSVAKVAPYLHGQGYALQVPLDTAGDLARQMQVGGSVPFLVLYDRDGNEVYRHLGYKEGDELHLEKEVAQLFAEGPAAQPATRDDEGGTSVLGEGVVSLTDQFEYSYSTESQREIVENWLDVSYYLDGLRTGILLNSQQPSEEGGRRNEIRHRFFEFTSGDFAVRAGHFYGMFGRGLLFAAYENRGIRVDTALDGVLVGARRGRWAASCFTGTPSAREIDIRGLDLNVDLGRGWRLGGSGLTHLAPASPGGTNRELAGAARLEGRYPFGASYLECGWKTGYDFESAADDAKQPGRAWYASTSVCLGPLALSLEAKDYDRFAIVRGADGKVTLNNPPSLTREHLYTLLSRNAHNLNPDDETGGQAELTWSGPRGWSLLACANRTDRQDGTYVFEEAYGHVEKAVLGRYRARGAYGFQDVTYEGKGTNHFVIGELTLDLDETRSLLLQAEHQHTILEPVYLSQLGGVLDPGAFDTEFFTLELALAPHWTFAGVLEVNNKVLPEQQTEAGEKEGPFPAVTASYATKGGGNFTVWLGQRQAGQICTGGICKLEPAFEGLEIFGTFRY